MEDSSLFNDADMQDPPLTMRSSESKSVTSIPETREVEAADLPSVRTEPTDPPVTKSKDTPAKEGVSSSSTWENNDFFKDAFASSPFDEPSPTRKDAFGFPAESAMTPENQMMESSAFFNDDDPDAWGEPSSLKSSLKPVDFTPRRNNASHFPRDNAFDDVSEMSEVTNPTFATQSKPDADGEDTKNSSGVDPSSHNRQPSQGSSSQEPSESAIPLLGGNSSDSMDAPEGSESQKENSG